MSISVYLHVCVYVYHVCAWAHENAQENVGKNAHKYP